MERNENMSKELRVIRALYDESPDRKALMESMENDEAFRDEYQALSEVKFHLDHRKRKRPEPHVIDAVVAAAASNVQAAPLSTRVDRKAVPGRAHRSVRFRLVTGILAALFVVSVGIWQLSPLMPDESQVANERVIAEEMDVGSANAESARQTRAVPESPAMARSESEAAGFADVLNNQDEADQVMAALSWDPGDEVRTVYRRLEMVRARSGSLGWGEPVVPLDFTVPQETSGDSRWRGIQPAFDNDF